MLITIAVILYAVQAPVLGAAYGAGAFGMLLALPGSIAVVLARTNAPAAVGLVLAGTIVIALTVHRAESLPFPWTVPAMLAMFVCCLILGYAVDLRQASLTWGVTLAITVPLEFVRMGRLTDPWYVLVSVGTCAVLLGIGIRMLRASEARADAQAEIGAQERERREILEEKAKMARELHDVVAHHMSVITVQAASAEYRHAGLPADVRDEFRAISEQSRSSLAELRRILGVLRGDDAALALAPQPGVGDLPRVIEHVERAGTPVELVVADLDGLAESVSIATYRIVQESLSNVVRHAPGARARIVIDRTPSAIELTVTNTAGQGIIDAFPSGGHGIRGMKERALALGGTLSAGPRADGGFVVSAWLPLQPMSGERADVEYAGGRR
ncbi:histidine kinase [Epidermidibacterium keratini]